MAGLNLIGFRSHSRRLASGSRHRHHGLKPIAESLEDRRLMTVRFGAASSLATNIGPRGVVLGDFDGDSKLDLAVTESGTNGVAIRLGIGDGTFGLPTFLDAGSTPVAAAAADLNGDGKLDLLVANFQGDSVSVLLGNGDGSFAPKQDFASGGTGPQALAVANLDGDTKLDLVVSNSGTGVAILPGNGDGTFGPAVSISTITGPHDIVAADLDGNGNLDLAVASTFDIAVFTNLGDGTFSAATTYTTQGGGGFGVAKADFNADGKVDLAQSNSNNPTVAIFLGRGDGTVDPSFTQNVVAAPGTASGLVADDFDKDGNFDLVTATGGGVGLLAGRGDGTFDPFVAFPAGANIADLASGDLNGDGTPDLVASDFNTGQILILLNTSLPAGPAFSIGDGLAIEGDDGTTDMIFPVTLSAPTDLFATVSFRTEDDSAIAGADYVARLGQITFIPGQTEGEIRIAIASDLIKESTETFRVVLSDALGAEIADGSAVGTIADNDQIPLTLSIGNAIVMEGDSGSVDATFAVSLSAPSSASVTVRFATTDASAKAGEDYASTSGTLTFAPGQTSMTVTVPVLGDLVREGSESFTVTLSEATGAEIGDGSGVGTITDDDEEFASVVTLAVSSLAFSEGAGTATIPVTRTEAASGPLTVTYTIETLGSTPTTGQITFAAGETAAAITFAIPNDTAPTPDREYLATLRTVSMGGVIGQANTTRVTITEDDPPYVAAPTITIRTRRRNVTALVLQFAAAIETSSARRIGAYRLALAGRDKTFGTRDDKAIRIKSAVYNAAAGTVILTTARPFARTLRPRLTIAGTGPLSLVDLLGRAIDGDGDGAAGGDAVLAIRRS